MIKRKSVIFFLIFFLLVTFTLQAQDSILTAADFFKSVSAKYGTITEYEAGMDIKAGKEIMSGKVSFKRPNLLRIDFSDPQEQVIVFNGDMLTIYLPGPKAILNQSVQDSSVGSSANLATPQGLQLMSRYYTISYLTGPEAEDLDLETEGSEKVIKLKLVKRTSAENFDQIILSVNPKSLLIRRVEATSITKQAITFDFTNYVLNNGIPANRFIYDPPSSANNYNNFVYSE
jgi:outer membrane lipoprotein-sorting protein